jgi:hypothetical protein
LQTCDPFPTRSTSNILCFPSILTSPRYESGEDRGWVRPLAPGPLSSGARDELQPNRGVECGSLLIRPGRSCAVQRLPRGTTGFSIVHPSLLLLDGFQCPFFFSTALEFELWGGTDRRTGHSLLEVRPFFSAASPLTISSGSLIQIYRLVRTVYLSTLPSLTSSSSSARLGACLSSQTLSLAVSAGTLTPSSFWSGSPRTAAEFVPRSEDPVGSALVTMANAEAASLAIRRRKLLLLLPATLNPLTLELD